MKRKMSYPWQVKPQGGSPRHMSKKGVFFTAMFIVLISIMLVTVSLWAEENKMRERRLPGIIKTDSFEFLLRQITDEKISNFSSVGLYRAAGRLANYEIQRTRGISGKDKEDVKSAIASIFENGTTRVGAGTFDYSPLEKKSLTLRGWMENMNLAAREMGFNLSFGRLKDLQVTEKDAWSLQVSFNVDVNITDLQNKLFLAKTLHSEAVVPIDGLPDPLIGRGYVSMYLGQEVQKPYRQFMHDEEKDTKEKITPIELMGEDGRDIGGLDNGQGWIYGYVTSNPDEQGLSGTLIWLTDYSQAGTPDFQTKNAKAHALIITRSEFDGNTGGKPFVSGSGNFGDLEGKNVLITTYESGDTHKYRIYDIENLRSLSSCQLYIKNPDAPSFLQRFLEGGEYMHDQYGIETFLVGTAFGGKDDTEELRETHDSWTRADYLYLREDVSGQRVKGMSGCKTKEMCDSEEAITTGPGHFRLDIVHLQAYGLSEPNIFTCPQGGQCD